MDIEQDIVSELPTTLRRKRGPERKTQQTCKKCKKTYPRNEEFFYKSPYQPYKPSVFVQLMSTCISCDNKRTNEWKRVNAKKNIQTRLRYITSERGFFKEMYKNIEKSKHGNEFKSFKEFFECWEEQKKIYGWICPILGTPLTTIRGKRTATDTNVSKDRILCSRPYGKRNLMFVSWRANNAKGDITPKIAKKFLHFVKERYGTDEVE